MKSITSYLTMAGLLLTAGQAQAQNWQLVWQDEFNGSIGPDWVFETGAGGWGNNELQYYRRENATIENNALAITAKREAFGGANYTSARMKTQGKKSWKNGKIVARIATPSFQGIWPAFWMLGDNISTVGWPACGEIDILEHVNTGNTVYGTAHWQGTDGGHAEFSRNTNTNGSINNYHEYSVEWTPNYIRWFVDGVQYNEMDITNGVGGTSELNGNFFILLNMAVGGNWPGNNIDNNGFPTKMLVDYVRVYQDIGVPTNPNPQQALFMVVNQNSGKALDLIGGNTGNAANINQWSYDYNGANQRWALLPTEGGNHFKLISAVSGKAACIRDDSMADGAQLHTWDYIAENPSHQWDLIDRGNGWYSFKNVRSGKVLDVNAFSTADNGKLQQWTDFNNAAQRFRLQPWGDYFVKASTGKYVCVAGAGSSNGNLIVQYQWENNPWFKWRFQNVGNGWSRASNLNALGRVLCVVGGSSAAGANTHLWDYNPANIGDQKLRIAPKTNGKYKFYFVHNNMSFDIPGGNAANSVNLQQYSNNGNVWQDFSLERVP